MDDQRELKYISNRLNLPTQEVQKYQAIPLEDAIRDFLPPYLHKEAYETLGINPDAETQNEKLTSALGHLGLSEFELYFSETEEGRLWYECNKIDFGRASQLTGESIIKSRKPKAGFRTRKSKTRPRFSSTTI